MKPSAGSKEGVKYVAADGGLMPNLGEVQVTLKAENGIRLENMKWQHADVNMPIMSVRRLTKKRVPPWNSMTLGAKSLYRMAT